MKSQKQVSLFGIGPVYTLISVLLTGAAYLLDRFGWIPRLSVPAIEIVLKIFSGGCLAAAVLLWGNALFVQKIDRHIRHQELVTTGAYRWVRNPIYSAIMLIMWSFLIWIGNLYVLLLCPVYPLLMAALLKPTEEKWLAEQHGQEYVAYCKRVHRCIPWFPRQ